MIGKFNSLNGSYVSRAVQYVIGSSYTLWDSVAENEEENCVAQLYEACTGELRSKDQVEWNFQSYRYLAIETKLTATL